MTKIASEPSICELSHISLGDKGPNPIGSSTIIKTMLKQAYAVILSESPPQFLGHKLAWVPRLISAGASLLLAGSSARAITPHVCNVGPYTAANQPANYAASPFCLNILETGFDLTTADNNQIPSNGVALCPALIAEVAFAGDFGGNNSNLILWALTVDKGRKP